MATQKTSTGADWKFINFRVLSAEIRGYSRYENSLAAAVGVDLPYGKKIAQEGYLYINGLPDGKEWSLLWVALSCCYL